MPAPPFCVCWTAGGRVDYWAAMEPRFDLTVNVPSLLTLAVMAFGLGRYLWRIEGGLKALETSQGVTNEKLDDHEKQDDRRFGEFAGSVKEVREKTHGLRDSLQNLALASGIQSERLTHHQGQIEKHEGRLNAYERTAQEHLRAKQAREGGR
jgi:hypothetical protein